MSWKTKYYLIYPRKMIDEIEWPPNWGNQCAGNLPAMLREHLKIKDGIGSEIKLIWNDEHRRQLIKDYNITSTHLEDYIKADCSILTFKTESILNKTVKALKSMGANNEYIITEDYHDVILMQAEFKRNGGWIL